MWPLQPFLETLAGLWDEQKRALAQGVRRVSFVNHAEGDEWWAAEAGAAALPIPCFKSARYEPYVVLPNLPST